MRYPDSYRRILESSDGFVNKEKEDYGKKFKEKNEKGCFAEETK